MWYIQVRRFHVFVCLCRGRWHVSCRALSSFSRSFSLQTRPTCFRAAPEWLKNYFGARPWTGTCASNLGQQPGSVALLTRLRRFFLGSLLVLVVAGREGHWQTYQTQLSGQVTLGPLGFRSRGSACTGVWIAGPNVSVPVHWQRWHNLRFRICVEERGRGALPCDLC